MRNATRQRSRGAILSGAVLVMCSTALLLVAAGALQPVVNIPPAAWAATDTDPEPTPPRPSCVGIRMICAVY